MAGHSKWANIQHRKKAQDAKRGKLFTKLIRAVKVAAKAGGPDPDANSALRLAISKANAQSVPKDVIQRAINATADSEALENIRYEGYGPGGVAVMVECLTDNRNRTVAEVRHAFTKCGGNLGTDGSVSYLFSQQGQIIFAPGIDEDKIMEFGLEAGAEDILADDDGSIEVVTTPDNFEAVKNAFDGASLEYVNADVIMAPSNQIALDKDGAEKMIRLTDMLEDLDDVQEVFSNADIPEDVLEELG